jgi:hypothetical protein
VDTHVGKHNIRVPEAIGELQWRRKTEGRVEEDVVQLPVALPELAVQVVVPVIDVWAVEVDEVPTEKAGHEHDASEGRELAGACGTDGVLK